MRAFRVTVEGKALGDLGVENTANAAVIVNIGRRLPTDDFECWLSASGLTLPDEADISRHFRWACPDIREGSRIEIEIVDSKSCIPPTKLYRSDHQVRELAFTAEELREIRYKSYLELKKEFEP